MKKRTLIVRGREAYSTDTRLVQGTVGQDCVALELDEEWRGLDVTVAFEHESGERRTPAKNPDGTYTVPWECLAKTGAVRAVVEGRGENGEVLKHARMERPFRVLASDAAQDAPESGEPTKTEWMQLADDARAATTAANDAAADVLRRAEAGELDGEKGEPGPVGPQGEKGERGERGEDGVSPKAGAGIAVAPDGTVSADLDGMRGMMRMSNTLVGTPIEGASTGAVYYTVTPFAVVVAGHGKGVQVTRGGGYVRVMRLALPFALEAPIPRTVAAVAKDTKGIPRYVAYSASGSDMWLEVQSDGACSFDSAAFPQLVLPLVGGGSSLTNLWRRTADGADKGVSFSVQDDGGIRAVGTQSGDFPRAYAPRADAAECGIVPGRVYTLSCGGASADIYAAVQIYLSQGGSVTHVSFGNPFVFTAPDGAESYMCFASGGKQRDPAQAVDATLYPMLVEGIEAGYVPYDLAAGETPTVIPEIEE